MKIVITENFENNEYVYLNKYFPLDDFVQKLKTLNIIFLKDPYFKIKFNLRWVAFRWVILVTRWWNRIPLFLELKKSKEWENIIWNKFREKIILKQNKALKDIEEGKFKEY